MNTLFKTFQPFFNKCKKTSLPILSMIRVQNGKAQMSDLESTVLFPVEDLPDGFYDLVNGEPFPINPEGDKALRLEDFPQLPGGEVDAKAILPGALLLRYAPCLTPDDLRPWTKGILITDKEIVATDAHLMRYEDNRGFEAQENFSVILPPTMPLLARCRVNPDEPLILHRIPFQGKNDPEPQFNVRAEFSDCSITIHAISGKYPLYKSCIPNYNGIMEMQFFSFPSPLVHEMAKTQKSLQCYGVKIFPDGMTMTSKDEKLHKHWEAPLKVDRPETKPDGLLMPIGFKGEEVPLGLSTTLLEKFLSLFKGNVIVGWYDPVRPMGIWLQGESTVSVKKSASLYARKTEPKPDPKPEPKLRELVQGQQNKSVNGDPARVTAPPANCHAPNVTDPNGQSFFVAFTPPKRSHHKQLPPKVYTVSF